MKFITVFISLFIPNLLLCWSPISEAAADPLKNGKMGSIRGRIIDIETKAPVIGASVQIVGTKTGAVADLEGHFTIKNVPAGSYSLKFSGIACSPQVRTDIIVRPDRITFVEVELKSVPLEMGEVVVKAEYFSEERKKEASTITFSGEEVRRAPGSAGDVSRILMGLPSIAKVDDQYNSIAVRGGSPAESGFYLDNIEIPNVNHFPFQGNSSGPIGLLNVDFIREVKFSAGGFSASYGDRLSSVMEIDFREGNREEFDGQVDLNFAGFGGVAEGPLGNNGSWMLAVKRSYLDLLVRLMGIERAPIINDYHGKVVYDLSSRSTISFLGIFGTDYMDYDREQATRDGNPEYGITESYEHAYGLNWKYLWGKKGYSNTTLSVLATKFLGNYHYTDSERLTIDDNSLESRIQLRNVNFLKLNQSSSFEFGFEAKSLLNDYHLYNLAHYSQTGKLLPALIVDDELNSYKAAFFVSHIWKLTPRLTTTLGLRYDYFDYNRNSHISPRFSFSYMLTDRVTVNGAAGIYYQSIPSVFLIQKEENKELADPMAYHYILGLGYLLSDDTRLTVETYYKYYKNLAFDIRIPGVNIMDDAAYGFCLDNFDRLVDEGRGESYGVEVSVQKKLVKGIYGLVSGAYSRSRYKGLDNIWRDRVFDNRVLFSIEGGYKPNSRWEFSTRWIYAGGVPYSPLNVELCRALNGTVRDETRINEERYPDYHSLNIRADRRFNFEHSNLFLYLSIWNAYNRKNISCCYWNTIEQKEDELHQWSLLPVFGFEFEF